MMEGEMSYALCFPGTGSAAMVRVDILSDPEEARQAMATVSGKNHPGPAATPDGADSASRPVAARAEARRAVGGLANVDPSTFPARNRYLLDVYYPDTEDVGPAHEILMSYRTDPIAGGEWAVPVSRFDAVLSELLAASDRGELFLPVVWLKKVHGESAWLSAADQDCVQCGIYHDVIPSTPSLVEETVTRVERIMIRHGGRPHLGKLIYMSPAELKQLYPRWGQFDALRREMDPDGMFWTEAIEARFGPSEGGPRPR
jgi:FAD/FMN-containing dehydrogenase